MKMESARSEYNENRSACCNCGVRFQRSVRRQLLAETAADVRQLLSVWISHELHPLDAVCYNCLRILQESVASAHSIRRFGYRNICIPCGSSILRAHRTRSVPINSEERDIILQWIPSHQVDRLEQVCSPCWLRASRAVWRQRQQNENRDMELQSMNIEDISNIPQPPPIPAPVTPAISRAVSTITMANYKRAASTSRHCIFKLCNHSSRFLIPKLLKERLLIDHSFYVPLCARICEYHLNEPHNDWNNLYTSSNCSDFTASQIDNLCSLLKSSVTQNYNILPFFISFN